MIGRLAATIIALGFVFLISMFLIKLLAIKSGLLIILMVFTIWSVIGIICKKMGIF